MPRTSNSLPVSSSSWLTTSRNAQRENSEKGSCDVILVGQTDGYLSGDETDERQHFRPPAFPGKAEPFSPRLEACAGCSLLVFASASLPHCPSGIAH